MGGADVSSIVNYVPQASILKNRLKKSGAWLRTLGHGAWGLNSSFTDRSLMVSSNPSPLFDAKQHEIVHTIDSQITITQNGSAPWSATLVAATPAHLVGIQVGDYISDGDKFLGYVLVAPDVNGNNATVRVSAPANDVKTYETPTYVVRKPPSESKNTVHVMWQPPIGFFDLAEPMGAGDYRLQLNPNSYYKTSAVQALLAQTPGIDFELTVNDVQLFIATINSDIPATLTKTIHFSEVQVQSKTLSRNGLYDFTVPSSTKGIAIFVQSNKSGTDTRVPPTLFASLDGKQTGLQTIQLTYANQSKPSTMWDSDFTGTVQKINQRYLDNHFYTGQVFNEGGVETFDSWLTSPFYYFSWIRDSEDRSTNLQLNISFGANLPAECNVYVASFYSKGAIIQSTAGFISNVQTLRI